MAGTMSFGASNTILEIEISLKPKSDDVGWEYGSLVDLSDLDKVKCKLCGKVLSGGIYRLKQHIAHEKGNVTPCNKSSDEDKKKCKKSIVGGDVGTQYRSGIYYYNEEQALLAEESKEAKQKESKDKRVVTEILPAKRFYRAEEYHQQYLEKRR